jgi:hypothetical protein
MKRFAFVFTLVGATALAAAPLAAQSRNDGPWWDPGNTGTRTTSGDNRGTIYDGRNGTVNGRNGTVYGSRDDGQWQQKGRDSRGNLIYVRRRYDRNGNVIEDRARRDTRGQFHILDSRVVRTANRNDRRIYDRNDRDGDRNNDGYIDQDRRNGKNDRWDQNNGHDNGKHNGWYKNKNKGKNKR